MRHSRYKTASSVTVMDYESEASSVLEALPLHIFGVRDVDREIFAHLDASSLVLACRVNRYTASLCDESFWASMMMRRYGESVVSGNRKIYVRWASLEPDEILREALLAGMSGAAAWALARGARLEARVLSGVAAHGPLDSFVFLLSKMTLDESKLSEALSEAAAHGNLAVVRYITDELKLDVDKSDALRLAVSHGQLETVKHLVSRGASCDDPDTLTAAIDNSDNVDLLRYLVESGVSRIYIGEAIEWAAWKGHIRSLDYLMEVASPDYLLPALQRAMAASGDAAIVYILRKLPYIDFDANPVVLEYAVESAPLEILALLRVRGCSLATHGARAARRAAREGDYYLMVYLNRVGVNICADESRVLSEAAAHGYADIVEYLVELGANIHARRDRALYEAARYGHLEIVEYLVTMGADVHAGDDAASRVAYDEGHYSVSDYLDQL